jgi:hypothetical protein
MKKNTLMTTEAEFDTKPKDNGVVITKYKGPGGAVVIPATIGGKSVTSIGTKAFSGYSSLASVEIPGSVTSICSEAFSGCSSLASVEIPGGVTSIGDSAFSGCESLTSVEIPGGVTSIGDWTFRGCTNMGPEVRSGLERRFGHNVL